MNKPEPMTDEQCDAIWPSPEGTNSIRAVIHAIIAARDAQWEQMLAAQEPMGVIIDKNMGHNTPSIPPTPEVMWIEKPPIGTKLYAAPQPAQEKKMNNQNALAVCKNFEIFGPDADGLVWLVLHGSGSTGKVMFNLGGANRVAAQVAMALEQDRQAAVAQPAQEPVAHRVVAGAIYDMMGWLTSRSSRLVLSDKDNAGPAADVIVDFAKMRGLKLDDADVNDWQKALQLAAPQPAQEPVAQCWCETCRPITIDDMRMVLCPDCGNKRCPKANFHGNACTGSNEVGQKGISWEHAKPISAAPQPAQEPTKTHTALLEQALEALVELRQEYVTTVDGEWGEGVGAAWLPKTSDPVIAAIKEALK